jgi:hypothetical protein
VGIDPIDLYLNVERRFGIRIDYDDVSSIWRSQGNDCTAGQLHDVVCKKCAECGVKVPRSSWNRLKLALVDTLGVKPSEVTKEAWLRRELGFD